MRKTNEQDKWTTEQYREYLSTGKRPVPQVALMNFDNPDVPLYANVSSKGKELIPTTNPTVELLIKKQAIFIPGNTPSLKNSREIRSIFTGRSTCCHAPYEKRKDAKGKALKPICLKCNKETEYGKRMTLDYSDPVKAFMQETATIWEEKYIYFKAMFFEQPLPYKVGFYFIRKRNADFDLINATQICQDLMKKYQWITDDSMKYINPIFIPPYSHVDSINPGVYICRIDNTYEEQLLNTIHGV